MPLLTLLRSNRQYRRTNGLGNGSDALGIGFGTVTSLDLDHDITIADHYCCKISIIAFQKPFFELIQPRPIDACLPTNGFRIIEGSPASLRFWRWKVVFRCCYDGREH